jgi:CPA2 family monovalent cation:H+ antiporter-2
MPDLAELLRGLIDLLGPQSVTEELLFIINLAGAVVVALVGGVIASRLGLPPVVGYVVGGMAIGPFTPGFVGDVERIRVLAEIGIVLLLFALGVQFSIRDVRQMGRSVGLGAAAQVVASTALGAAVGLALGLAAGEALLVGAALSISSTLVLVKLLSGRGEEHALHGRVAVAWGVVQDLATVVLIAVLPALGGADPVAPILLALVKAAAFLGLAYLAGARLLPRFFREVARLGSSELFLLTVMGTALVAAVISSAFFGLSLALGAFVAGFIVSESDLSHQAAAEVIPFRDLFAVLFFVSVGMLVDPAALMLALPVIAALVVVVLVGKGLITAAIGRAVGFPARVAILAGAALAQAGEFTFLIAGESLTLELMSRSTYNLVLGTAVGSILLAPLAYALAHRIVARLEARATVGLLSSDPSELEAAGRRHVVILGGGDTGWLVAQAIAARALDCVVVDRDSRRLERFRRLGAETVYGDAANPAILRRVLRPRTRILVLALPDALTTRLAVERARAIAPRVEMVARVRGTEGRDILRELGVRRFAEDRAEAGIELARQALQRLGISSQELAAIVQGLRRDAYGP